MSVEKPFFSVIMPAHNAEKHIHRALDSIAAQSFRDFELIVVCDACEDHTALEVQKYRGKIPDIRIIPTNYGLDGMARNAGIDDARGEWILFIDDDDWFLHEYVFQLIADSVKNTEYIDLMLFGFIWKGMGYIDNRPQGCSIAVWSKCWKHSFIGDTRFPDTPYWSDKGFMERIIAKHPKVTWWGMPMYYYNYLRPGSISWRKEAGEIE